MKLATKKDRANVVQVLQNAFQDNPTMQLLTRKAHRKRGIAHVIRYAFDFALRRKGVFVSSTNQGAVICYVYNEHKIDLVDVFNNLKLVVTTLPLRRLRTILSHCKTIARTRPRNKRFLYIWFLGVDPSERPRVSPMEFKKGLFTLARKLKLDIYAETTRMDLKVGYERMGFEVYKEWYNQNCDLKVWFLKRSHCLES